MNSVGESRELEPVAVAAGAGEARWWLGCLAEIKLRAEQSGGLESIVEITEPPLAEAPLHVHHNEDEGFWVLDGVVRFEVGGSQIEVGSGDFAFGPMSTAARERTLPPPGEEPPDFDGFQERIAAYGCEMVG